MIQQNLRDLKLISLHLLRKMLPKSRKYLDYEPYPVYPELRCTSAYRTARCGNETKEAKDSGAYNEGTPYDCQCNLVNSPYSFPYESFADMSHTTAGSIENLPYGSHALLNYHPNPGNLNLMEGFVGKIYGKKLLKKILVIGLALAVIYNILQN
jgi:hypothetical protein